MTGLILCLAQNDATLRFRLYFSSFVVDEIIINDQVIATPPIALLKTSLIFLLVSDTTRLIQVGCSDVDLYNRFISAARYSLVSYAHIR